ncbi:MAG: hypothetical protein ACK5LE_02510 [Alphaproteobacteria bacterium]
MNNFNSNTQYLQDPHGLKISKDKYFDKWVSFVQNEVMNNEDAFRYFDEVSKENLYLPLTECSEIYNYRTYETGQPPKYSPVLSS